MEPESHVPKLHLGADVEDSAGVQVALHRGSRSHATGTSECGFSGICLFSLQKSVQVTILGLHTHHRVCSTHWCLPRAGGGCGPVGKWRRVFLLGTRVPGLWGSKPLELPAPLHPLQSSPRSGRTQGVSATLSKLEKLLIFPVIQPSREGEAAETRFPSREPSQNETNRHLAE